MIQKLSISNYALIEFTEVNFVQGFTVITGETGAGKSIMLEAIALVLGSRANFSSIRKGEEKCSVEVLFHYNKSKIDPILKKEGLDVLNDLILRRELTTSGRSRAFVNDSPVTISVLKEVSSLLVDLHGQQENTSLHTSAYQTQQLDLFSNNQALFVDYQIKFNEYKFEKRQLESLQEAALKVRKDENYFQFQFDELSEVDLSDSVYESLETELGELEHAEEIQRALQIVSNAISSDDFGAVSSLRTALNELKSVSSFSKELKELFERLNSSVIEIEDIQTEAEQREGAIEHNPARLEVVREQLDIYSKLFHKHAVKDIGRLREIKVEYELKLQSIASYEEELEACSKRVDKSLSQATLIAKELTQQRQKQKAAFEQKLIAQVHQLGMPKAHFKIELKSLASISSSGNSEVHMLFNANSKEDLAPITDVASGGEVSRLMLGLKSILSEAGGIPTLIFDEIDTGVSGEVAKRIGSLMKEIGAHTQIIAVTHLPGVAAKGSEHFKIAKSEKEGKTISQLISLSKQQRIEELAAMFSGDRLTEASLESARLLLEDV